MHEGMASLCCVLLLIWKLNCAGTGYKSDSETLLKQESDGVSYCFIGMLLCVKGIVHPKIKMMSLIAHPRVVPNL